MLVSINTCLVEKDGGGNTGADAPESVFKPPPSLLLLIKVSLGEKLKSLRRQGGGIGDRAAVTSNDSLAVERLLWVVGGSGDQGTQGQGTQGPQNCDSRMKNIFLELKHYTTTDWDFACGECKNALA